jgi:hypothetical protein
MGAHSAGLAFDSQTENSHLGLTSANHAKDDFYGGAKYLIING